MFIINSFFGYIILKSTKYDIFRTNINSKLEGVKVGTIATSANAEYIMSEEYFDKMIEKGCKYGWFFNYMPVGCGADTTLLTTPEQREKMYYKLAEMVSRCGANKVLT